MQKVKDFCASKYFTVSLLTVGALAIICYYFCKVPGIFTVWELVDEYGYMANAAYLSGEDWAYLSNMYYGYGYSLWLVPLFWLCGSGVGMIRAAVMFNAVCVVGIFLTQYILMKKLCKDTNKNLIVLMSFVLCFYPFIVSSGLKVLCEVLLTLVVWVTGLLLYQALETGKWYYYMLSAISTVYMYFVHTRSFVFCGVIVLFLGLMFLLKKVNWKQLLIFGGVALLVFMLGAMLKNQIVDVVYSNKLFEALETTGSSEIKVGNMVTISGVIKKIFRVLGNLSIFHIYTFASRNFYIFVSTLGMFHVGAAIVIKESIQELKNQKNLSEVNAIKLLFVLGAAIMVIATVVQSAGSLDVPSYNFYGRYYEYIIGPVVLFGIDYCINNRIKIWSILIWLFGFGVTIWLTMEFANHLNVHEMYFDSARIAAFAAFSDEAFYYRAVIRAAAKFTAVAMLIIVLFNNVKKLRVLIPIVLLVAFMFNNNVITRNILTLHANNKDDYEIAVYVDTYYPDKEEIYFVNGDNVYVTYYAGIQCLLGHEKLVMVEGNNAAELKTGDIFVTFHNNRYLELIEEPITKMWETQYFELYMIE